MKIVTASDANRRFTHLLREVSDGERITIVSEGKPIATIAPVGTVGSRQEVAKQHLLERLYRQPIQSKINWKRDELYD